MIKDGLKNEIFMVFSIMNMYLDQGCSSSFNVFELCFSYVSSWRSSLIYFSFLKSLHPEAIGIFTLGAIGDTLTDCLT